MANYIFLNIKSIKKDRIGAAHQHNERKKKSYPRNPDIDVTKSHLNYHIIEPEKRYFEVVKDRIDRCEYKPHRDHVLLVEGVCTPTASWIEAKPLEEQREFFAYVMEFMKDFYGADNMISAVVHMDESHPHMHFVFTPIQDGRFSCAKLIGSMQNNMRDLQSRFYEHISKKYPDISRGIPKDRTHRKHLDMTLFKSAAELNDHYNDIYKAIQDIGLINNAKQKDTVMEMLSSFAPEVARMNIAIQSTNQYIKSLENETEYKDRVIDGYKEKKAIMEDEILFFKDRIRELEKEKEKLEGILSRIPQETVRLAEEEPESGRERS
ncbi:MAG: plasmid recombination protein [Oscillospiraceae bacterium]|nr:plasmid recombination protein [Oscillospiraceae bacterium]